MRRRSRLIAFLFGLVLVFLATSFHQTASANFIGRFLETSGSTLSMPQWIAIPESIQVPGWGAVSGWLASRSALPSPRRNRTSTKKNNLIPQLAAPPSDGSQSDSVQVDIPPSHRFQADHAQQSQYLKNFEQSIQGLQKIEGLFTLYRDRSSNKLLAEIKPDQLNVYYLCTMTLEWGIGEHGFYSGLPLEDFVFVLKRVNNSLQFVAPNIFFRTQANDPLQRSIQRSFSDSTFASLPIKAYNPKHKSYLVELGNAFLEDFPGLTRTLALLLGSPYTLDPNKSHFGAITAFPANVELESVYSFTGSTTPEDLPAYVTALPNNRHFNLHVRYSLSQLPNHGYRPRRADERVGYFITAFQNLSDTSPSGPFVRNINRWHLEKQDPKATLSPPKQPIVFWLENTIPLEYRDTVREGVLMWNQAFEKAGFKDAIQVQQMPVNAKWDPADVRYNTIRWINTFDGGFLGMGPFRTNPLTGEILDADILIDSGFVRYLKQQYQAIARRDQMKWVPSLAKLVGNPNLCSYGMASRHIRQQTKQTQQSVNLPSLFQVMGNYDLCYGFESAHQFAFGAMAQSMVQGISPRDPEAKGYVWEFLRYLIAHEVGHTLGLRHNFRASTMLTSAELNDINITHQKGLISSVMDYSGVNIAPVGTPQGDYFTHVIGPYDEWAIAYGYTPAPSSPSQTEAQMLKEIARRAPEPDLAYATDEDAFAGMDPQTNPFDLSRDLLTYAPQQLELARQMWQRLEQRYPLIGGSFSDMRIIFDDILEHYFQYTAFLPGYIGGQSFNRYQGGDAPDRYPFEAISLEQQRQALTLLNQYVFAANAFQFSPNFLNKLAPSRWNHWGQNPLVYPLDYPIQERIAYLQTLILNDLLDYFRLGRLRDAELKAASGQALTLPELFDTLQTSIWGEISQPSHHLRLSSLRQGLQRNYLDHLAQMVLRQARVPDDARVLARYHLKQLQMGIEAVLKQQEKQMDRLTLAHLEESRDRITQVLAAQLGSG
jgi:hypothetical protein